MTTIRPLRLIALGLSLVAVAALAGAATVELLPTAPGDLAARELTAAPAAVLASPPSDEPVRFAWKLAANAVLADRPEPVAAESRGYWLETTAAELGRGVALDTTAAGAVVRVNPLDRVEVALDPATFEVVDAKKRALPASAAMDRLVSAEQLAASDSPFAAGTAAFRLRAELGSGRFLLRVPELEVAPSSRFVVHVFEPASTAVATLAAAHGAFLVGDAAEASGALTVAGRTLPVAAADAFLIAPDGRRTAVDLFDDGAGYTAVAPLADAVPGGALWEIELRLQAESEVGLVRRDVRAAFAVAAPTARLDGRTDLVEGDGLVVRLGLETAAAGRYEVRGTLFGTAADGALVPVAVGHGAAPLAAGRGELELAFPADLLAGVSAPFEVRDLQLVDQTRMGVLHRQARALVIE